MKKTSLMAVTLFLAVLAVSAFAQDPVAAGAVLDMASDPQALVQALFTAALPFLISGMRKLVPTMPRLLVWALVPSSGVILQWLGSLAGMPGMAGWKGFIAGLAAVGLREFFSTLKDHGLTGTRP